MVYEQVYIEKKKHPYDCFTDLSEDKSIPMTALWCPSFNNPGMANLMMPETHQPIIVIILIIYSVYLLKNLVELKEYISGRIASYLFQFLRRLHSFLSAGL